MQIKDQKGAVLVFTLWVLAAITVAAGYLALWFENTGDRTLGLSQGYQAEREILSTQATVLYLLSTSPFNYGGMMAEIDAETKLSLDNPFVRPRSLAATGNELRLDGKLYKGVAQTLFSIQDLGGLVGLNNLRPKRLERLLGQLGVPPHERSRLIDRLQDYTDLDDFRRLYGAEKSEYTMAGRSAPPNRMLGSAWEARNVLGWEKFDKLWRNGHLPRLTTPFYGTMINLNNSPLEVLMTIDGMDQMTARRLIDNRPYSGLTDVSSKIGRPINLSSLEIATVATQALRISVWHPELALTRELIVRLIPAALIDNAAPWIIEYELDLPVKRMEDHAEAPPGKYFAETDLG